MQALYSRLRTSPHLADRYITAFETLVAGTVYAGMGERIHDDVLYRVTSSTGDTSNSEHGEKRGFAQSLAMHLHIETARCSHGYPGAGDGRAQIVIEGRGLTPSTWREALVSSIPTPGIGEWPGSGYMRARETATAAETHSQKTDGRFLRRCECARCTEELAALTTECWAAVQRGYVATQELEAALDDAEWSGCV